MTSCSTNENILKINICQEAENRMNRIALCTLIIFKSTSVGVVVSFKYSEHPLSRTPTGPAKKFEIVNVRDSGKFKILAF